MPTINSCKKVQRWLCYNKGIGRGRIVGLVPVYLFALDQLWYGEYMENVALRYPKKSHRKVVRIPLKSKELAEFIGIMLGDGGINNPWQANISMNSVADATYARYVENLIIHLFGVQPAIRRRKERNTLVISLASTTIVDFLVSTGLPRGDKLKAGLKIPKWILKNPSYRKFCVRGLVDTDGCLYIHKHRRGGLEYKNIGLCFCSHSPILIEQITELFEESGIMPHINGTGRSIYLYRADAVAKYLKVFGTSNERIGGLYQKWKGARVV